MRRDRPGHDLQVAMIAVAVFLLAFSVRFYWAVKIQSPWVAVYSDMAGYVDRANQLLSGKESADPRSMAFYPWGAHALIAAELWAFGKQSLLGIGFVHAFVGALPAFCATLLTARLVRSLAFVSLAGVAVALWHPQITYVGYFMSEIWFSGALLMTAWLVARHLDHKTHAAGALAAGVALAVAFCVRPQVLMSCAIFAVGLVLLKGNQIIERVALAWHDRRSALHATYRAIVRPLFHRWFLVLVPLAIAMGGSSYRLYRLSGGRIGIISENDALNRVFADTKIGKIESSWKNAKGEWFGAWYAPAMKLPIRGDGDTVSFTGYIGDPEILERIRKDQVKDVPIVKRIQRAMRNVRGLAWHCFPNPEEDFARNDPRRAFFQRFFYNATLGIMPLALVGLWGMRRKPAGLILIANLLSSPIVAALYFAEARHRVPYDPFLVIAAVVGVTVIARYILGLVDFLRRRSARGKRVPVTPPAAAPATE
jgi:hypothetical protein